MNFSELQILFEDQYLLAINKPHGLVTDRDSRLPQTLESLALEYIQSKEKYPQKCFIGLPHRLDRPVSGVVLLAKKKSVLKMLSELFTQRAIGKTYLAVTECCPPKQEDELAHWLTKDFKQRKALIDEQERKGSVKTVLCYKRLAENKSATLLQIKLITGKFHQIRAQLAYINCPIVGDTLYGSSKSYKENAIALHAWKLELTHPVTNTSLVITAHLPDDEKWNVFKNVLD